MAGQISGRFNNQLSKGFSAPRLWLDLKAFCIFVIGFMATFSVVAAVASVEVVRFADPVMQSRYQVLIEEMRCPKCQNQNLAGSDAPVALDLRREIRRLLEEGFTDAEITEYMVARYGDFVLYRPPLQRNTLALWLAPGVFALFGLVALIGVVLRSRSASTGNRPTKRDDQPALSAEERVQLQKMLGIDEEMGGEKQKND